MLDEMDKCNDFFADRQEILLRDGRQIIQELERAEEMMSSVSYRHRVALKRKMKDLHRDIKWVYVTLNGEVHDLRRFCRVNFDLCVRLLKRFANLKRAHNSVLLLRLWKKVGG